MRFVVLIAAVLMQLCLGATYAWSVFVGPLQASSGLPLGTIQIPFTLFYIVFPATVIFSGRFITRFGPHRCAAAGGILFGAGWLAAGFSGGFFPLTILGIGVLGGMGVGLAYVAPIATCIQWFPRNQGLVTGIAVAGFGGGAALVTQAATLMMHQFGAGPFAAFRILGLTFLVIIPAAGMCMRPPPTPTETRNGDAPQSAHGAPRLFLALYLAMFAGLAAGFMVNANLKQLFPIGDARAVGLAVSLFALANALGRITWGALFDKAKSGLPIQANLFLQALVLAGFLLTGANATAFYSLAFLAGFNYGGVLVLYAASIARLWGPERVPKVYGRLFSANIAAAAAPALAGYAYDAQGAFTLPIAIITILLCTGAAITYTQSNPSLSQAVSVQGGGAQKSAES